MLQWRQECVGLGHSQCPAAPVGLSASAARSTRTGKPALPNAPDWAYWAPDHMVTRRAEKLIFTYVVAPQRTYVRLHSVRPERHPMQPAAFHFINLVWQEPPGIYCIFA